MSDAHMSGLALIVSTAPSGGEYALRSQTSIGRSKQSGIRISDPTVSKVHAHIMQDNGQWTLHDAESRNGSFVNGEQTSYVVLQDGDLIRFGDVEFRFQEDSEGRDDDGSPGKVSVEELLPREQGIASVRTIDVVGAPSSPMDLQADEDPAVLLRRLQTNHQISDAVAETLDLDELLDRVLEALFAIFTSAERAFIMLVDPETQEKRMGAVKCRGTGGEEEIDVSQTALDRVLQRREAVLCVDAKHDDRFSEARSIMDAHIRSMMLAPLLFREQIYGAIYVDKRFSTAQFMQGDLQLLSAAASDVAACVANAALHRKVVKAERMAAVGETVAGLSHCIKNILQGIRGGAFVLEKGLREENLGRIDKGWQMVKGKSDFMEELVWDLLSISKPRLPEYEPTDLNALCAEVCEIGAGRAEGAEGIVLFQPGQDVEAVDVDPKGMRRCLLNLVTNAVDACGDTDGTVTVRTSLAEEDGMVRIAVTDAGCGMEADTLSKLFKVFFSTKGSKGTGLGLSVTKKIVEEHGGRIEVQSELGKGTTFEMILPVKRTETK